MIALPQTEIELINLLIDAAELGAKKALEAAGLHKPFYSLTQAKKLYGAKTVNRWIAEKLVKPIKDGDNTSKIRIPRDQIEAVARVSNRASYLTVRERLHV